LIQSPWFLVFTALEVCEKEYMHVSNHVGSLWPPQYGRPSHGSAPVSLERRKAAAKATEKAATNHGLSEVARGCSLTMFGLMAAVC